jgi:hypothetical protein
MSKRKKVNCWSPKKEFACFLVALGCLSSIFLLCGCEKQPTVETEEKMTQAKLEKEGNGSIEEFYKSLEKLAVGDRHSKLTERKGDSLTFLVKVLDGETNELCIDAMKSGFARAMKDYADEFELTIPSMSLDLGDGNYLEFTIREKSKENANGVGSKRISSQNDK